MTDERNTQEYGDRGGKRMNPIDATIKAVKDAALRDIQAVRAFAMSMHVRLAEKRLEGCGEWQDREACTNALLSRLLREAVEAGDPLDTALYAMMIARRNETIAPPVASPAAGAVAIKGQVAVPRRASKVTVRGKRGKPRRRGITRAQRETLMHCRDWSAAWEVAERRNEEFGASTDWKRQQDILRGLELRGLVVFGKANGTWRASKGGLAAVGLAVADEAEDGGTEESGR